MATINLGRIKPVFRGAYAGGTAYVVDDIVTSGNETFICILASTGNATSNATYWTKLAAKGTDGTDLTSTLTTQGDVVYRDGSGLARLGFGTSGHVLTTQGTGANPTWAAAVGGKVLQVVGAVDGTARATTSTSWVTASSTLTLDITPSATSSKILLMLSTNVFINANDGCITIYRDSTNLGHATYGFSYLHAIAGYTHPTIIELDAPSSTSAITYAMYIKNNSGSSQLTAGSTTGEGSLVAMEIGV